MFIRCPRCKKVFTEKEYDRHFDWCFLDDIEQIDIIDFKKRR